jgi:ABC-type transport system involved in multi-copper enzyme maturation permease subunit
MSVFVITRLTVREASRRWVLWAALALGVVFLAVYAIGVRAIRSDMEVSSYSNPLIEAQAMNFFLQAGLYVVNFLLLMMSVLSSVDTLSGEINSGTIHTLVSKPVRRWEIVLGKWLGFELMLTGYLALMAGGVFVVMRLFGSYGVANPWGGLVFLWLNTALLLSISFLGGAYFSTIANGVLAFGLYSVAFIGSWIEQFGTFMKNETAVNIGIVCSLIMPAEALWRMTAAQIQSTISQLTTGFTSPFSLGATPSPLFIGYSILYILLAIFLAMRRFAQRDL